MEYKPKKSLKIENICGKWAFVLENDNKYKFIRIKIDEKNNYNLIADNKESIMLESRYNLTN